MPARDEPLAGQAPARVEVLTSRDLERRSETHHLLAVSLLLPREAGAQRFTTADVEGSPGGLAGAAGKSPPLAWRRSIRVRSSGLR